MNQLHWAWRSESTLQRVTESPVDGESSLGGGQGEFHVRAGILVCVCFTGLCDYMNVCPCMYFLESHSALMISGLVCSSCVVGVCLDLDV